MLRSKNKSRVAPAISTASLPDIVFMLLFFFMVVTNMRTNDMKLAVEVPSATELTKLENKTLVSYIYLGKPTGANIAKDSILIQLGNEIGSLSQIKPFIEAHRARLNEKLHPMMVTSLKVDKNVPMSLVSAVKLELRKANQLKINYIAVKELN
jgi:biopolymer transport protein ExbD